MFHLKGQHFFKTFSSESRSSVLQIYTFNFVIQAILKNKTILILFREISEEDNEHNGSELFSLLSLRSDPSFTLINIINKMMCKSPGN